VSGAGRRIRVPSFWGGEGGARAVSREGTGTARSWISCSGEGYHDGVFVHRDRADGAGPFPLKKGKRGREAATTPFFFLENDRPGALAKRLFGEVTKGRQLLVTFSWNPLVAH